MADAKFEEVIRLAFETAGTEGIKQAATALAHMGDVSEEARLQAAALLDDIGNVEKSGAAAKQYEQVGKSVLDYQHQISAARTKVVELAAAVKASEAPTKAQQRELAKSRSTLSDLVGEQKRELGTLRTLKTSLDAQGISTRSAAAAQKDLASRTAGASKNLRSMVSDLKRTRDADARLQASLAAAAQKSKRETDQYDASLRKVRAQLDKNKHAAVEGTGQATAGLRTTTSVVNRLKGALVGLGVLFSAQGVFSGIKSILSTGDQFVKFQKQLTNMYGDAAGGKKAFEWVKTFAKDTPLQLDQVMQSFIQLRNFGIDPMAGAMQAAVDQNAKLGGESERLQRITLAMGQAFAKGKLQGDDIKQMIEAGVPVWQLLAEVTGKNVQQLQKMSEAGALGTDVMEGFFAQMGSDAAGAATDQMDTLSGQFSNLQDNIQQFEDRVSRKGVLDYFKDQLSKLNALFAKMAADGSLDAYAKRVSDALVSMAQSLKSATMFVVDHASAIKKLVQVYVSFKLGKILLELAAFATRLVAVTRAATLTTAAAEGLSVGLGVLRGAVILLSGPIGWIIGALALFATGAKFAADAIVDYAVKHGEAAKKMTAADKEYKQAMQSMSDEWGKRAAALAEYQNVQVKSSEQTAAMTTAERASYKERLAGYVEYTRAMWKQAQLQAAATHDTSDATTKSVEALAKSFQSATVSQKSYGEGVALAAKAAAAHMSVGTLKISEGLKKVEDSADQLQAKVSGLFADFGKKTPEEIGDLAVAFGKLGARAGKAGEAIRVALHGVLKNLTEDDLIKLQEAGDNAFVQFGVSAKEAAVITESTLQQALERLGVSAEQWGLAGTDAALANMRAFKLVATNASATAATIEAAFNKALANATTIDDAKALGDELKKAGEKGKVGFDATERAVAAVENRMRSLKAAVDPLADDFARLGITSQRSLDAAAAAAKTSFDNIVRGAHDGKAAMSDVRAAFEGYANAQLDSVQHAETWKREQVKNALETQAAVLGVSDELTGMGAAGFEAGHKIARGAHEAKDALDDTAKAAGDAEVATERVGDKAQSYAEKMAKAHDDSAKQWVATGKRTSVAMNGLSRTFLQDLANLNTIAGVSQKLWRTRWNETVAEWSRQGTEVEKQIALLDKQNAVYDEMAQRIDTLREKYKYLNDDQLGALAQAQKTLEDNQKRVADEARQKGAAAAKRIADQAAQQTEKWNKELGIGADGAAAPNARAGDSKRIAIDLSVSASQQPGAVPAQLSPTDVQKIANEVVRVIGIARTSSN